MSSNYVGLKLGKLVILGKKYNSVNRQKSSNVRTLLENWTIRVGSNRKYRVSVSVGTGLNIDNLFDGTIEAHD